MPVLYINTLFFMNGIYLKNVFWPNLPESDKARCLPCEMRSLFLWGRTLVSTPRHIRGCVSKIYWPLEDPVNRRGGLNLGPDFLSPRVLTGNLEPKSYF